LRINNHGDVYVPDSEDEGTDTEMEDAGADAGAAAVMVPATGSRDVVTEDGALAMDRAPAMEVVADRSPAMEVAVDGSPAMEVDPEMQARLAAVLADTLWYSFCARELMLRVLDPPQLFCGHYSWAFLR
jgi:hypothetical protein